MGPHILVSPRATELPRPAWVYLATTLMLMFNFSAVGSVGAIDIADWLRDVAAQEYHGDCDQHLLLRM
jgi:hypothetical protein